MSELEDRLGLIAEEIVFGPEVATISLREQAENTKLPEVRDRVFARFTEVRASLLAQSPVFDPDRLDVEAFRSVRDELLRQWSSSLLAVDEREWGGHRGRRLFFELRTLFQAHVHFPEEWEYDITCLYVFQCCLADLLPAYFYALIDGTKGTGKTTLLDHISRVTNSLRLQSFTLAALSRSMTKCRPVSIDEFDIIEKNPEIGSATAALVRQGYKWDAAPRRVCAPRTNEVLEFDIAGPKAITFRYELDDALKDRGFRLPMASGADYRLVVLGMAPEFGDIRVRIHEWAVDAHNHWTFPAVCARIKEPAFEQIVYNAMGAASATRGAELVTIAVVIAEIAGTDISVSLRAAMNARERENAPGPGVEELLDALGALASREGPKISGADHLLVAQTAVRAEIDRSRKERKLFPLKNGEFAGLRRDAGIHDDWRVTIRGKAYWKVPLAFIEANRPGSSPSPPSSPCRQDDGVARVGRVPTPSAPDRPLMEESDNWTVRPQDRERKPDQGGT